MGKAVSTAVAEGLGAALVPGVGHGGLWWVCAYLTTVFSAAAEPEAEERYRSSVRGASLCRSSLRTNRPEEGGAAGGCCRVGVLQAAPRCSGLCWHPDLGTAGGRRWRPAWSLWKSIFLKELCSSNKKPHGLILNTISTPLYCSEVKCRGKPSMGFAVTKIIPLLQQCPRPQCCWFPPLGP